MKKFIPKKGHDVKKYCDICGSDVGVVTYSYYHRVFNGVDTDWEPIETELCYYHEREYNNKYLVEFIEKTSGKKISDQRLEIRKKINKIENQTS